MSSVYSLLPFITTPACLFTSTSSLVIPVTLKSPASIPTASEETKRKSKAKADKTNHPVVQTEGREEKNPGRSKRPGSNPTLTLEADNPDETETEREEENEFKLKKGSAGSGSAVSLEQELPHTHTHTQI